MCVVQVILQCQVFPPPFFTPFWSLCCCGDTPPPGTAHLPFIVWIGVGRRVCVSGVSVCVVKLQLIASQSVCRASTRHATVLLSNLTFNLTCVVGSFVDSTELCCCCLHLLFKLALVWLYLKSVCVVCVCVCLCLGPLYIRIPGVLIGCSASEEDQKNVERVKSSFRFLTLGLCGGDIKATVVTELVTLNTSPFPSP